jgi:RES domain-containing protein
MVEYFVHLDDTEQPSDLVLATAEIPRDVSRTQIKPVDLPENWRTSPAPAALAAFGDEFVKSGKFAALVVPSALAPEESNWLLNPAHPEFRRINFSPPGPFQYDRRFF